MSLQSTAALLQSRQSGIVALYGLRQTALPREPRYFLSRSI